MNRLLLLRHRYDSRDLADRHYLSSLIHSGHEDHHENISIPFSSITCVDGSSLGGLVYLDDGDGKTVICNPTTKALKFLDPPKSLRLGGKTLFHGSGFGYDPRSDDYKVVRYFTNFYQGGKKLIDKAELYSLNNDSWKDIEVPYFTYARNGRLVKTNTSRETGVYVSGSCYWLVSRFSGASFDFTKECFSSSFDLPPFNKDDDIIHHFLNIHDKLGVSRHKRAPQGCVTELEIFIWKKSEWISSYSIACCDVQRPLLLWDARFLFIEKRNPKDLSQLVVYDLKTQALEELNIYESLGKMRIFLYAESLVPLRDAKLMIGSNFDEFEDKEREAMENWKMERKKKRTKRWKMIKMQMGIKRMMKMIRPKWGMMLRRYRY